MNARPHIVYLTMDGLLEPTGYARVVRVVTALADRNSHRFTICSLEPEDEHRNADRVRRLEAELRARHVRWRRRTSADGSGPLEGARNVRALAGLAEEVVDEDGADLLHARDHLPAFVARRIGDRHDVPYLFDTRGRWVDERLEDDRWFGGAVGRRAARMWETGLYRAADGAVVPTRRVADQIRNDDAIGWPDHRPVEVVYGCVDYDAFGPVTDGPGAISEGLDERLGEALVVGCVDVEAGDPGFDDSVRLFEHVLARRPEAHLVVLTRRPGPVRRRLERRRIPARSYTVETLDHRRRAGWLRHIDWGLMFGDAADGAMPGPLGEFFAAGVRPVYAGADDEGCRWTRRAASGVVVDRTDEEGLREIADRIADATPMPHDLWGARWRTRSRFGLQGAVRRYDRIYDRILSRRAAPRMRVLFLTEGTTIPSSRFRVQQLIPHLEARDIECTVRSAYGDGYNRWSRTPAGPLYKLACKLRRFPWALDADQYDVVFLQRPALPFSALAERLANWRNPHTIFDVDDAIFVGPDGRPRPRKKEAFEAIVDRCAHVICGNDYLAERTRHLTPTSVIPTVVDTDVYRPADTEPSAESTVRIGWMGTSSNFESLGMVAPLLGRLVAELDEVEVVIVADDRFSPLEGIEGVHQIEWSADREVQLLRSFDIGLMPLVDNRVTRGKCGFKAIQYMAVATPVVTSPVGVNQEMFEDREAGVLAGDLEEWERALRDLIDDPGRRRQMGWAGRRLACREYSVQSVIDRYVELFETVARRGQARPVEPMPEPGETSGRLVER